MKKTLPKTKAELEERIATLDVLSPNESPRGKVLIAGAVLEERVELAIRSAMKADIDVANKLFRLDGPLSSFATKIRVAYMFGIIEDWAFADLEIIKDIRNEFAHTLQNASFDDPSVKSRINKCIRDDVFHRLISDVLRSRRGEGQVTTEAEVIFLVIVVRLITHMDDKITFPTK